MTDQLEKLEATAEKSGYSFRIDYDGSENEWEGVVYSNAQCKEWKGVKKGEDLLIAMLAWMKTRPARGAEW